jgi:hypothetical protein
MLLDSFIAAEKDNIHLLHLGALVTSMHGSIPLLLLVIVLHALLSGLHTLTMDVNIRSCPSQGSDTISAASLASMQESVSSLAFCAKHMAIPLHPLYTKP